MGQLICDFPPHKGLVVKVDPGCLKKIQDAVESDVGAAMKNLFMVTDQANPKWHIIPDGTDWHITPWP